MKLSLHQTKNIVEGLNTLCFLFQEIERGTTGRELREGEKQYSKNAHQVYMNLDIREQLRLDITEAWTLANSTAKTLVKLKFFASFSKAVCVRLTQVQIHCLSPLW